MFGVTHEFDLDFSCVSCVTRMTWKEWSDAASKYNFVQKYIIGYTRFLQDYHKIHNLLIENLICDSENVEVMCFWNEFVCAS